jgi:hypothetical protein
MQRNKYGYPLIQLEDSSKKGFVDWRKFFNLDKLEPGAATSSKLQIKYFKYENRTKKK